MKIRRSDSLPSHLKDFRDPDSKGETDNFNQTCRLPDTDAGAKFTDASSRDEVIATWKALQTDVRKIRNGIPSKNWQRIVRDAGGGGGEGGGGAITNGFIQKALIVNKNVPKKRITYDNRIAGGSREADRSSSFPLDAVQEDGGGGRRQSERSASAARRRNLLERLLSWRTRDCECRLSKKKKSVRRCICTCSQTLTNGNASAAGRSVQFGERGRSKSVGYVPTRAVAQFRRCNSAAAAVGGAAALRQRAALTLARRYYPEGGWGWTVTAVGAVVHVLAHGLQLGGGAGPIAHNAAIIFRVPPLHTYGKFILNILIK